jgi:hypothetical protein
VSEEYRIWVNAERTVLVRLWGNGVVEVATRPTPDYVWSPPVTCKEEK